MKTLKGSPEYLRLVGDWNSSTPSYLMLNLNTSCSYRCPKCALPGYRRQQGEPLTFAERQRVMQLANEAGTQVLVIVGTGEPTENFGLVRRIIETANTLGMITIMFTTANSMTVEQAQFYQSHNVSLIISLDSLQEETYRKLTGGGDLKKVLGNLAMLRQAYCAGTSRFVRLGINTTVVRQNVAELQDIRRFAGDDMQYVANPPIKRGRLAGHKVWEDLVGDDFPKLEAAARELSETGGHSSIDEGVCSYFYRGISVDVDGRLLSCGYAAETGEFLDDVQGITSAAELVSHYNLVKNNFDNFAQSFGSRPSCPLREGYPEFVNEFHNQEEEGKNG